MHVLPHSSCRNFLSSAHAGVFLTGTRPIAASEQEVITRQTALISLEMKKFIATIVFSGVCLLLVEATRVQDCETGEDYPDASQIKISDCEEPTCRLRRKTVVSVEFKFTPENDIPSVRNGVNANIVGIPFPFIGVDGTNACDNIFQLDGSKASCPLIGGTEYIYKNGFKILDIYPKIKLTVNWALFDPTANKSVICFKVDAKITS